MNSRTELSRPITSPARWLQRCLLVLFYVSTCSAFNFDLLSPTIVNSGVAGGDDITFGFSLAQHSFSTVNGSRNAKAFVGAPKADSATYQREGGVYSCPFINGGTCQFEDIFQSREDANPDFFRDPLSINPLSNTDQLLGFSLRSMPSGYFVACAPLYVHILDQTIVGGTDYFSGTPRGRCVIVLNPDLQPVDSTGAVQILQLSSADITGDGLQLSGLDTGSLEFNGMEYLALSSSMSGASPIPAGQVYLTELTPTGIGQVLSSPSLNAPALPLTGYHIETGFFTVNSGTKQIATSAPRGENHMGQILIMTVLDGGPLDIVFPLSGDEVDGYFGYDFALLDANPQGYHSLVVGCPLCAQERGRVYVLTHTGVPSNPFNKSSILSPSPMRGRFGLAVENIGDVDNDGYSDIAVSAPYVGAGVVYIYRGAGDHLVIGDYQEIPAVPNSKAFGYSLSGGLDIDSNGYADLTIGDLSGSHVTTFRSSPLVTVIMEFQELRTLLDIGGDTDRLCPLTVGGNLNLLCFNVTPCLYHESSEVEEFAISYTVTVDPIKKRVGLYIAPSGGSGMAELSTNTVTGEVTIAGAGRENMTCPQTYTFALSADFTETTPIPVDLSVGDVAQPLPLTSDPTMEELGGPLHPVLRRYIAGDEPQPLSIVKEVAFNVNCSGESDPEVCEPSYEINIVKQFGDDVIPLASTNEFGFKVNVTNKATDDGLNPTLLIVLPKGVLLSRYESLSPSALTSCNTRATEELSTTVECALHNPTLAGVTLQLAVYFLLNDSDISLDKEQIQLQFSTVDGTSQTVVGTQSQAIGLEAVAGLRLSSLAEESYRAFRSTLFVQNISTIPLNETGPLINLQSVVQNTRHTDNGTTIPRLTLKIHLPVEVMVEEGDEGRYLPVVIPTEVLAGLGNVNCSHYNAVPEGLSTIQEPTSFLPAWTGSPLPSDPRCERSDQYRCGVIICTITELKPAPASSTQITLFARLYSASVTFSEELTIVSEVSSDTDLPRLDQEPGSSTTTEVTFQVSPPITEVPRDCLPYWVVVVPVVIGIFSLTVIIAVLGCCGLFRRWYKVKKSGPYEETDNGYAYHRRTIPPIPGLELNNERDNSSKGEEPVGGALDKEKEAEAEAELEMQMLTYDTQPAGGGDEPDLPEQADVDAPTEEAPPPTIDHTYDPSVGVGGGEGMETDL